MPDWALILFWLTPVIVAALLAWLFRREIRARAMQQSEDIEARYKQARGLCIYLAIFIPLMVVSALHKHDQSWFKRFFSPACLTVLFTASFFQFLQARRKLRAHPDYARNYRSRSMPVFFWQAVLILLPVALMAGFGFWAILRERNAAELQAQQRAHEILSSLPDKFGRMVASQLTDFQITKNGWDGYLSWGVAAWPENKMRQRWLADTNNIQMLTNQMANIRSVSPEWPAGPVMVVNFSLDPNDDLLHGHPFLPQPPSWLAAMSGKQWQAWNALQTAAYAIGSLSNLVEAFRQTQPPPLALTCADLMQLRAASKTLSATNAINRLLRFAGRHYDAVSESGVPLKTLALAEALKRAHDCGPTEQLWDALRSEVLTPSMLTPILLDEASRLAANNAQLSEALNAMRIILADRQAQSELADAIQQSGKSNGIATTNLWVDAMSRRWFCVLSPSVSQNYTSISNRSVSTITPITEVWCYPQSLVARGFADALKKASISLPDYLGITIRLEGETVQLPSPWNHFGDEKSAGDSFAEGQFQMSSEGGTSIRDGNSQLNALLLARPGGRREGNNIFFDDLPSHPRFSMQIRLTDRPRLYARQRQLQWIFGAMIAASALAAMVGFAAAYRSFRREQQLNKMKTNFVSSVSHELRAPIASVRLMAENLEGDKIRDPEKQKEYFRFIGQECRRLSSLIENVLDFSRIEQGRKQYEFEPTDLMALTRTTVQLMEPYAMEKGVRLEFHPAPGQSPAARFELEVDGRAIQQALVNLVDNAIKHSAKGQTVTLEIASGSQAGIHLSVSDSGPGIPKAEQERIFERFYRLGSELRRETQGIGIGLSIVKHIVAAHGGRVTVESVTGQGSRFTIILPAKK